MVETGKEWVAMGMEFFIAIGVFPVELLAYQVSMDSVANWPRMEFLFFCGILCDTPKKSRGKIWS